jgi:hydrogenase expression/formation protein HypD
MKHLAEYRDPVLAGGLLRLIRETVATFPGNMTLMEVCGTHTMAICQQGIRDLLPASIRLISGPGCPVCVTPVGYIDRAIALARRPGTIIASFGDMLRVPGSTSSLQREQAAGRTIKIVYSPLDAVSLAERLPDKTIVFLGVGFETTAPAVAGAVLTAQRKHLPNFRILCAHKTMPNAMTSLLDDPDLRINGYLCPAHVSAIIGSEAYSVLSARHRVPCVITGFEPLDILQGIFMLARQVTKGEARIENQYRRVVKPAGNLRAQLLMNGVFEPCDADWRGIGEIPGSGLRLRSEFAPYDASRLDVEVEPAKEQTGCLCGEILKGKARPTDCPLFGGTCSPEDPVGACMVSSEGTCAAEYKYGAM